LSDHNSQWLLATYIKPALHNTKPNNHNVVTLSRMNGGGGDDEKPTSTTADNISKGRGVLLLVAVLHGTLNVSLRLVYALPDPPTASALSATRGWLAALCFIPLLMRKHNQHPTDSTSTTSTRSTLLVDAVSPSLLLAGLELAVWNFGAQGLLSLGLLSTGSARASFLTQLSVVLTPIISLLAGQRVK
jgi:drug/metabolite transporter (DMT)-like permease